ncbi:hypothetical protein L208DRAFT_1408832 [Tricholoma matsutake]|nr:hypothetical protein L208DRAFT_1408832 [Tricholoma matsutake 945]
MPYQKMSRNVKLAAIRLHERALLPLEDILDCLRISHHTFYHILLHLHFDNIEYLKRLISHHPDWFLDELQYLLATNCFISAHYTTIHQEVERVHVSTKKLKKIVLEQNENVQADFIWCMAQYQPEQLGFLDEVSKDEWTSARCCGRSMKGFHAVKKGVFVHGRRFSAEGLLTVDRMVSNTVVEGLMMRAQFLEYLEHSVVCLYAPLSLDISVSL